MASSSLLGAMSAPSMAVELRLQYAYNWLAGVEAEHPLSGLSVAWTRT
jgi:hypothetical protein